MVNYNQEVDGELQFIYKQIDLYSSASDNEKVLIKKHIIRSLDLILGDIHWFLDNASLHGDIERTRCKIQCMTTNLENYLDKDNFIFDLKETKALVVMLDENRHYLDDGSKWD